MDEIVLYEEGTLTTEDWYWALVEDCKNILVEGEFAARWIVIQTYWQLGERICQEIDLGDRAAIYGKKIVQQVGQSLGKSKQTIYNAINFYRKFPNPDSWPFDKAISWRRICQHYLPASKPVEMPPLPEGRYRCLVIDPPWPAKKIEREVRPNQGEGLIRDTVLDYPMMSLDDVDTQFKAIIEKSADPAGCHVYLWTTHKYLPYALEMFKRYGVKYQCLMTWVKNVGMTPYSWMYDTEHVLFGRVGNLQLSQLGLRLSFSAPTTKHSEKPDVFYERARQASPGPRLNLYARKLRDGFESWGNEVV